MIDIIEFKAKDGAIMNGFIYKSDNHNESILIEIHGMGSNCFKKRERIIANEAMKIGIVSICFNTRGSELVKNIKFENESKKLGGTLYEDVEESYYDICGAIEYVLSLGYKNIYLQGHSLGSTKVVYTYNRLQKENSDLLKNIKKIILLSLVDIPGLLNSYTESKKYIEYALECKKNGKLYELMPQDSFIYPVCVETYLRYAVYNSNIDFAKYGDKKDEFEVLNKIEIPLFLRWGDTNEMVTMDLDSQVKFMNEKIKSKSKDIGYIKNADHSYNEKEEELAKQICIFLKK